MAKSPSSKTKSSPSDATGGSAPSQPTGEGGEVHQTSDSVLLTTNQGVAISDDQNSLRVGPRGPTLLEDFVLREKITHFDHERIPERVVHARGSGAHGFFETLAPLSQYTRADFLQEAGAKVPVFVRFSTVAGGAGSVDLPRDVRGFAVKFYTREGNFDLVGNNIPVFFIQDAIKFPDLVHSVKMEPDRGFPQAASAHDTFWDFMSLTPESTHMVMWAMSDRAIPRSYRMIEGFGVHTFRLVNKQGGSTFVKFHWRPKLGLQSVVWDEAIKINGADSDYHRRDLWHAIESGNFPEWELFVQLFTEEDANGFDFDVLDATKLIPEELVPLIRVGRLVLDRNPTNFFAETEQVAFCAANIVPGIDFTNDPLLQGRLFSYLDTQLLRLGGPNFNQLPINAPKCPMHNFQRDGHMQMALPAGRVNYEPNTLAPGSARENPRSGFRTFPRSEGGGALRVRPEAFADHYSQARLFWKSQTEYEQGHIVAAYVFELSKVETDEIRERVISHLVHVDPALASRVCAGLGLERIPAKAATNVPPKEMPPSPSLSIIHKSQPILTGRSLACLVTEGVSATLVEALLKAVEAEGAELKIIAPKIGGVVQDNGQRLAADAALSGGPSVLFDAVVILACDQGIGDLLTDAAAVAFVVDAYHHLKVIGHSADATPLLLAAQVPLAADAGVVSLSARADVEGFITAAKQHRIWERERRIKVVV